MTATVAKRGSYGLPAGGPGDRSCIQRISLSAVVLLSLSCTSAEQRWGPALLLEQTPASKTFHYSQTVGSEAVGINYEQVGAGKRAVIFLHGFASSIRNWDDIRDHFDRGDLQLLFLDLKGFGLSARPRDDSYRLLDQAMIVRAFIEARGFESVVLVGHSYGGAVALMTTVLFEDAGRGHPVEQLILIDAAAYAKNLPLFIDLLRAPVLGRLTTWLLPRRLQLKIMLKKSYFDNRTLTPEMLERYARFYRLPGSRYSLRKVARQAVPENHADLENRYPELEIPTYILWGRRDLILRLEENAKRLAKELRARRFETVEECGHIPQEEEPAVTAEILSQFLVDFSPPAP